MLSGTWCSGSTSTLHVEGQDFDYPSLHLRSAIFVVAWFDGALGGLGAVAAHQLRMLRVRISIILVSIPKLLESHGAEVSRIFSSLSWRSWQRIALIRRRSTVRSR